VQVSPTGERAPCVNLSDTTTCNDGYGHGTFMAGLIAAGGTYPGVATEAKLVSIKVASDDGSADVSNVLAGIQWAVSFRQTTASRC
jgi:serine protease AprX